jgi:hypothetical protein
MVSARCDRCGSLLQPRESICTTCSFFVDIVGAHVIDAPTEAAPLALDAPTDVIARPVPVDSRERRRVLDGFASLPPTDPSGWGEDPFAPRATAQVHRALFASNADAVVLGDPSDIAGSLLVDQPDVDADADDFLEAPTDGERRQFVPVQLYLGRDVAAALTPDVVLCLRPGIDVAWVPLSPLERRVLQHIDGARPVARVQALSGLTGDTVRLALALLFDKGVLQPAGLAQARTPSSSPPAAAPASPSSSSSQGLITVDDAQSTMSMKRPAPRQARSILASLLGESSSPTGPGVVDDDVHRRPTSLFSVASARRSNAARAASLHAQALQALDRGQAARGYQLARLALDIEPDNARYRETVERWGDVVGRKTPTIADDARLYAEALKIEDAGDVDGAIALLRRVIVENDKHAAAWNRLGLLLLGWERDVDGASAAFERAVLLDPAEPSFRTNLGKVLAIRGGPTGAGARRYVVDRDRDDD